MLRDGASAERLEQIDDALTAPPEWRDPLTGLPEGFATEEDEWALWKQQTGR